MCIRIFVTGGTFDKEYDEIKQVLFFKETHINEVLKNGRCKVDVEVRTLMMVDSREMTTEDRQVILNNCKKVKENKIIITHGTDTMVETAEYLARAKLDKTIVFTGAMVPYRFGSSDGLFNLGASIGFVQALAPGVYIVMNGKFFNWDNVRKNLKTGEFEELK
jgi:L-asparaginase